MPSDKPVVLYACPCGYTSVQPAELRLCVWPGARITAAMREKALDVLRESAEREHRKECELKRSMNNVE